MNPAIRIILFSFFLICLSAHALADDDALENALEQLTAQSGQVSSVASDFVQKKELSLFQETLLSKGKLYLQKPDRLRWEYVEPSKTGFSVNGGKGKRWSEMTEGVSDVDVSKDMSLSIISEQLLAWASVDTATLEESFRIALDSEPDAPITLVLTPKSKRLEDYIERITISFADDARSITSVKVSEAGGDSTTLLFQNTRLNTPLADDLF